MNRTDMGGGEEGREAPRGAGSLAGAALGPDGEAEWRRLAAALDIGRGFQLAIVVSPTRTALDVVRDRTRDRWTWRGLGFHPAVFHTAEDILLLPVRLDEIASGVASKPPVSAQGVIWVDGWLDSGEGREAWAFALSRINERRDYFRGRLPCLLALAGPFWLNQVTREAAPDLWSVRTLVVQLPEVAPPPSEGVTVEADRRSPDTPIAAGARSAEELLAVAASIESEAGLPELGVRAQLMEAAADDLWRRGDYGRAVNTAERSLDLRRASGRDADAWTAQLGEIRALSRLGWMLQRRRALDRADRVLSEAVELAERLVRVKGQAREAERWFSVVLANLGDVRLAQKDQAGARAAYERSLEIAERIVKTFGETPEALRDLSVSLNKVGDVRLAQKDQAGARAAY
ncbi:MAG: tetratricopeptide repeat protein, partial [Myxococcota bacterium]|nr:tetratricopeptide repeat protein [Myxococcota bacterium]